MAIYAGIDCGTQSTKVLLIDTEKGCILAEGNAPHHLISEATGKREQQPQWWIDALVIAFKQAVAKCGINSQQISGMSVSGQQHGFVPLDRAGKVLHPAKLWCDTETVQENQELVRQLGGEKACLEAIGLNLATGYTASKILWFKKYYPELYQQLACVLLPHNYINYWLTGIQKMEFGDASGTGLFDIVERRWNTQILNRIDDSGILQRALPPLSENTPILGVVTPEVAKLLDLSPSTFVANGSGDNMMSAIGTGNIQAGIITMSLGTSGTLFAYSDTPIRPASKLIANFCSANGGWLPLICTMNITSATSHIQKCLKQDLTLFNQALAKSEIGANGIVILPFFNGERVPDLPQAKASIHNLDSSNFTDENLCRAIVESATYTLRYGLDLFRQAGIQPRQIRLIGGGAKSHHWRQIVADVTNCEVITLKHQEAAALGAAIQAACAERATQLSKAEADAALRSLCEQFVVLEEENTHFPQPENVRHYAKFYQDYLDVLNKMYAEA